MIETLESVVLDSLTVGEKDVLVILFTKDRGKVSVIAKNARVSRKRFPNSLQPMTRLLAHVRFGRGGVLEDSEVIEYHQILKEDPIKAISGLLAMEVLSKVLPEGKREEKLYNETLEFLSDLEDVEDPRIFSLSFIFKALSILGYLGLSGRCSICGRELRDGARFLPSRFTFVCPHHQGEGVLLSKGGFEALIEGKAGGKRTFKELSFLAKRLFLGCFGFIPNTFYFLDIFKEQL